MPLLGELCLANEKDPSQQHPSPYRFCKILYPSAMINLDRLVDFVTFLFADDKFLEAALFATAWI